MKLSIQKRKVKKSKIKSLKYNKYPIRNNKFRIAIFVILFAIMSVSGIGFITNKHDQSGIGNSNASIQEPADINNDNKVDVSDLSTLLSKWNSSDSLSDVNKDGIVNVFDLSILLNKWGVVTVTTPQDPSTKFSFIVLPDTQAEQWQNSDPRFSRRINWIVSNKNTLNIKYVMQVGDLQDTDNCSATNQITMPNGTKRCNDLLRSQNTFSTSPAYPIDHYHFEKASRELKELEKANIPWNAVIGNHDSAIVCGGPACDPAVVGSPYPVWDMQYITTTWNKYYPPSRYNNSSLETKGFFEANKSDNLYTTFTAGGVKWLNFYNNQRPHESLKQMSPNNFAKKQGLKTISHISLDFV